MYQVVHTRLTLGRPSRRGVDRNSADDPARYDRVVAPHAGAWIETRITLRLCSLMQSRPSRRGVDRNCAWLRLLTVIAPSPLTQGRGSKRRMADGMVSRVDVAPHAGAWIETMDQTLGQRLIERRPSRRGVDRNLLNKIDGRLTRSRPSRRGVDRNKPLRTIRCGLAGRPSRRGVDRNSTGDPDAVSALGSPLTQGRGSKQRGLHRRLIGLCRPSRRGVDRNMLTKSADADVWVAPHAGAWIETHRRRRMSGRLRVAPHAGAWIETTDQRR